MDGRPFYSEAVDVLQRVFGYAEFRPGQFEAISAALSGSDVEWLPSRAFRSKVAL